MPAVLDLKAIGRTSAFALSSEIASHSEAIPGYKRFRAATGSTLQNPYEVPLNWDLPIDLQKKRGNCREQSEFCFFGEI